MPPVGAVMSDLRVVSWNTELVPKAGRLRFLERAEACFDFDVLLIQEWARQSDLGVENSEGEFRIVTCKQGESAQKCVAIVLARRWQHHTIRVKQATPKTVALEVDIDGCTHRLVSTHCPTTDSTNGRYDEHMKALAQNAKNTGKNHTPVRSRHKCKDRPTGDGGGRNRLGNTRDGQS